MKRTVRDILILVGILVLLEGSYIAGSITPTIKLPELPWDKTQSVLTPTGQPAAKEKEQKVRTYIPKKPEYAFGFPDSLQVQAEATEIARPRPTISTPSATPTQTASESATISPAL